MLEVWLLGCGGTMPTPERFLTALWTRYNGHGLLIDCGEGTQTEIRKLGWGFDNFVAEADQGKGLKFPRWARFYVSYILPVLIIVVLVGGWIPTVKAWFGA